MSPATNKLPSGKTFSLRAGTGQDLLTALRMPDDPAEYQYALVAILAKVDGQELTLDDALDKLCGPDLTALQVAINQTPPRKPGKLPSGKAYQVRPSVGRDNLKAERLASHPTEAKAHLAVAICAVEGYETLTFDDFLAMPIYDAAALMEAANSEVPTQAVSASP